MRFEGRTADAFRQVGLVVNDAGIPNVAPLTPWHKDRPAAGRAAAMLAFAAGPLVAALGAWAAGEPARPRPTDERAATHSVRAQPDVSASHASDIDKLYRQLIGPPPATSSGSRLRAAPNDDAAGSVRHWASPR